MTRLKTDWNVFYLLGYVRQVFENLCGRSGKGMAMWKIYLTLLFWSSVSVSSDSKIYSLSPAFNGVDTVEFVEQSERGGQSLKGYLISKDGRRYSIPDVCEPEGGDAELIDAYTVKGKEIYFLFTCAWRLRHSGIGVNGTLYETFVYTGKNQGAIIKETKFSRSLSGYEGTLEGGGSSYAWYWSRKTARKKILEIEAKSSADSLVLSHSIVLSRLGGGDYEAVKFYLSMERIQKLLRYFPMSEATVTAYNDFGYALGRSGDEVMAYRVLREVEKFSPDRVVLKLNIADVLWRFDKEKSKAYYKEYVVLMRQAGKEKLIPLSVFERTGTM